MPAKVPWLPSVIPPGARPERCPNCGRMALIPWTLRRDNDTTAVLRTWVCTECQTLVERPEPEQLEGVDEVDQLPQARVRRAVERHDQPRELGALGVPLRHRARCLGQGSLQHVLALLLDQR